MRLLREMMRIQNREGAVSDEALQALARRERLPLYRLEGLRSFYPVFRKTPGPKFQLQVCRDIVCAMAGGRDHCKQVRARLADRGDIEVSEVSCLGRCDSAPAAAINDQPVSGNAEALQVLLAEDHFLEASGGGLPEVWLTDPYRETGEPYDMLRELLADSQPDTRRDAVITALKDAGLRGLGGAAFPTGMKWDFTRKASGDCKYVICNADESEPGTFKDRGLLAHLPHLIIEAMIIGGWVIGAQRGIVYIRHEYHAEAHALQQAIDSAYAHGALGSGILGSDLDFDLEVFISPGGYILGEETALLEALEDRRGEPRNKPPFPTNVGLQGQPTLMNNVETFCAIPAILHKGVQWWQAQGCDGYSGLKYLSISGDVARPGIYCLPWGSRVSEALAAAGDMRDGGRLLAFSPGGSSTNFLPASQVDLAIDFDSLQQAGSAMGTGAMVFVDDSRDLLELVMHQVRFFRNESCGKCVPCRIGSHKAVQIVEAHQSGEAAQSPAKLLRELHGTLATTSICGLGHVALAPLVSALEMFAEQPSIAALAEDRT